MKYRRTVGNYGFFLNEVIRVRRRAYGGEDWDFGVWRMEGGWSGWVLIFE